MDSIISAIFDKLPDWLTLVLASGIVAATIVFRVRKVNGPVAHIVDSLRIGIVTEQRISQVIGDLLRSWIPNDALLEWVTKTLKELLVSVPEFFKLSEEQQAAAVASIFSKLPEAKAASLLGEKVPEDVVKVQFARKRVLQALWNTIVTAARARFGFKS